MAEKPQLPEKKYGSHDDQGEHRPDSRVKIEFAMPDVPGTITDSASDRFYNRINKFITFLEKECQAYDVDFDVWPIKE